MDSDESSRSSLSQIEISCTQTALLLFFVSYLHNLKASPVKERVLYSSVIDIVFIKAYIFDERNETCVIFSALEALHDELTAYKWWRSHINSKETFE